MVIATNAVLQYFYVSWILIVPAFCGLERTCDPSIKNQGRRGVCGSQLTQLISVACMFRGGYSVNAFKRSTGTKHIPDQPEKELLSVSNNKETKTLADFKEHFKQQLVSKRQAMSFLVKKAAYDEQGIVCECCYFQCSFREITDYCRGDNFDFIKRSPVPEKRSYIDKIMKDYHPNDIHDDNFAASTDIKEIVKVPSKTAKDMH